MMFNLYVQQNQWIAVALLGGSALMILFCLTYWALWRPRGIEGRSAGGMKVTDIATFFRWLPSFMPWALILVILSTAIYGVTHLLAAATQLPNW